MRIVCPSCVAEYEVPESRLKPGKLVRCARCGNNWVPAPEAADDVFAEPLEPFAPPPPAVGFETTMSLPDITAMDRLVASPAPRPWRTTLIGAWLLTFVVLAGAVAAAVAWRDTVINAWPPGSRILAAIGQAVPQPARNPAQKPE